MELSEEKTHLTHIRQGFDFLSQNIRKYKDKLLIKPSRKSIRNFLQKVKQLIIKFRAANAADLLTHLAPLIRGWTMYHRHVVVKYTFNYVDHRIWQMLWKWAYRRHAHQKGAGGSNGATSCATDSRDWTFFAHDLHGNLITIFQVPVAYPSSGTACPVLAGRDQDPRQVPTLTTPGRNLLRTA
ncbi:MAG: hypothetical protein H6559_03350 [Lewinellaceae bacterium]|nr:hypothetical protein [Lewinellaceae bacterium]